MVDPKKPTGGKAFDELMGKLVQVPKKELDRAEKAISEEKSKTTQKVVMARPLL